MVLGFTLTSQKPRLWSPSPIGCLGGGGGSSRVLSVGSAARGAGAGRRRSWVRSRALGVLEHAPSSAPEGAGRWAGSGLGSGSTRPLSSYLGTQIRAVQSSGNPGSLRTGTRRPAAQDDIKSPPPPFLARTSSPLGGLRQGGLVAAGKCSPHPA